MEKKKLNLLLLIGLICVAVNLRAPITAVGPLVPFMKSDLPFSNGVFGLLTTIPLIMFAVFSPFVRRISDIFGAGKALLYAIILAAAGILLRSYAGEAGLFIGTVLLGMGVAVGNVLVLGIIKARFPDRIGLATGAFTISMTSFSAVSAAVSYPLSALPGMGWRNSLVVWVLLAVLGVIVWFPHRKFVFDQAAAAGGQPPEKEKTVWRSGLAWWLTVLMGAQSFMFYFFTAWLPSITLNKGLSPETAGYIAFAFQLMTIPAALIIPAVATRLKHQRGLVSGIAVLYIASLAGVALSKTAAALTVSAMFYGFSTGCCFNLCMLLISMRARSAARATSLSGMVQSIGYTIGALGPILCGWLFDLTGSWNAAFVCGAVLIGVIFVSGRKVGSNISI